MTDSNNPHSPLSGWQREYILAAAAFLRDEFGNPPADPRVRVVHDSLLEVLDPSRRAVRLQIEMSDAARLAAFTAKTDRRKGERRTGDRRRSGAGIQTGAHERRTRARRSGVDRRFRA